MTYFIILNSCNSLNWEQWGSFMLSEKSLPFFMQKKNPFRKMVLGHFNRNTYTPTLFCRYPISQSCGSSAVHKIMQISVTSHISNGKNVIPLTLSVAWLLAANGLARVFHEFLFFWYSQTWNSLEFTQNVAENKKHPVNSGSAAWNILMMIIIEIKGECSDWIELTGSLVTQSVFVVGLIRKASQHAQNDERLDVLGQP